MTTMRQRKRLTQDALNIMRLKNAKNKPPVEQPTVEPVAAPEPITAETVQEIGNEVYLGAVEGFREELKKHSPAVQHLAEYFKDAVKEFFVGFREGIDTEIKAFIHDNSGFLKLSPEEQAPLVDKEPTPVDIDKIIRTSLGEFQTAHVETFKDLTDRIASSVGEGIKNFVQPKVQEREEEKRKSEREILQDQITHILRRNENTVFRDQSVSQKAGDFLTMVAGNLFGIEGFTDKKIEERNKEREFITVEKQLRKEREDYKGLSESEIETRIREDYRNLTIKREELRKVEEQVQNLLDKDYKVDQIEKLGYYEKQKTLVEEINRYDSSRALRVEKSVEKESKSTTEEIAFETAQTQAAQLEEERKETILLSEIRDLIKRQVDGDFGSALGAAIGAKSGNPGGWLDKLLPGAGVGAGAAAALKGAGAAVRAAGRGVMTLARKAPLKTAAKVALPLAAGLSVFNSVREEAQGKTVENLQQIVPEGLDVLNPFEWVSRGGRYVGDKVNKGVEAATGTSVGSGLYSMVDKLQDLTGGLFGLSDKQARQHADDEALKSMVKEKITKGEKISENSAKRARELGIKVPDELINKRIDFKAAQTPIGNLVGSPVTLTDANYAKKPLSTKLLSDVGTSDPLAVAAEVGKNITVTTPAPVVIPTPAQPVVVPQPFITGLKNTEPSVTSYIRNRYAPN